MKRSAPRSPRKSSASFCRPTISKPISPPAKRAEVLSAGVYAFTGAAGDAVVFDCNTLHAYGVNLGSEDRTLRLLRRYLGVKVFARGGVVTLEGDEAAVRDGVRVVEELLLQVRGGDHPSSGEVEGLLRRIREDLEVSSGADADARETRDRRRR